MENPIKMDDLGVPLFLETPIWKWIGKGRKFPPTSRPLKPHAKWKTPNWDPREAILVKFGKYSDPIFARGIDFLTLTLKMVPNFETSKKGCKKPIQGGRAPTIVINGMNWGPHKMAENKRVFLKLFHPT